MLLRCSLNGIDDSTGFDAMRRLLDRYEFAEFGLSYSERPGEAGTGCYASLDYAERLGREFSGDPRVALHLCYREATGNFLRGQGRVAEIARHFKRIQLNYNHGNLFDPNDLTLLRAAFYREPGTTLIMTRNPEHPDLWEKLRDKPNLEILFDASAGRGLVGAYPDPAPGIACGYAGGLCPENLGAQLPLIHQVALKQQDAAKRILWVDMESRLRAGRENFPLDRAEQCLVIMRDYPPEA